MNSLPSPILIAGPCAAESREQVLTAARLLSEQAGAAPIIFRAGAWKPRTSPRTFQGLGAEALTWLAEARLLYHFPVATEVATPEHVRLALAAGIDYLWLGARTSASPIAVQAIADALRANKQKPLGVLVKNPVNPDPELWLGNLQRIASADVPVIAVHRGCSHRPCWSMAHKVRLARPDIPMLLDPSHLTGDAALIPEAVQKVALLALDGAMVEVHPCPADALSDAVQQLTPDAFCSLLPDLQRPADENAQLNWYRAEIDELDDALWDTLLQRLRVCEDIGTWKKQHHMPPLQPERFEQILYARKEWGRQHGISPEAIETILSAIHSESLRRQ